ncbi:MAG: hypothetical protein R3D25_17260 [Geminicoccaceae bacterium]
MPEAARPAKQEILLWWRDDDAGRIGPTLAPLLDLSLAGPRPIGLAIVPAWLDAATTRLVRDQPNVQVLQHGWTHANHALPGEKTIELGGAATTTDCLDLLRAGAARLDSAFGDAFLPVLVPPWNRIAGRVLERLGEVGYAGLSTFADDRRGTASGLVHVNAHVDIIDWRGDRRMKPIGTLIAEVEDHLAHGSSPVIGVLSHHLVMSVDDVARLGHFFSELEARHPCRWAAPRMLFTDSGKLCDEPADRRS